jgi:pre-mRNA-splicing helicase BRR2
MISKLPDLLNAEIVLGTVNNVKEATDWYVYFVFYSVLLCIGLHTHIYMCV